MKLSVEDLNSYYGPAHILFDIALEVGEGEVVALLGPQRRRQVDDVPFHRRPGREPLRPYRVRGQGRIRASRRMRSCAAGSAMCRKSGASSRT